MSTPWNKPPSTRPLTSGTGQKRQGHRRPYYRAPPVSRHESSPILLGVASGRFQQPYYEDIQGQPMAKSLGTGKGPSSRAAGCGPGDSHNLRTQNAMPIRATRKRLGGLFRWSRPEIPGSPHVPGEADPGPGMIRSRGSVPAPPKYARRRSRSLSGAPKGSGTRDRPGTELFADFLPPHDRAQESSLLASPLIGFHQETCVDRSGRDQRGPRSFTHSGVLK